jgi:hypothetical protein
MKWGGNNMVRINENYIIDVDEKCYAVKFDKHKTDKKGNAVYDVCGYYGSLESAIKGVIKSMNSKALSEGIHSLEQAIEVVSSNNRCFENMLKKALEEMGE